MPECWSVSSWSVPSPKSDNLTWSSFEIRMFSGLMSLWAILTTVCTEIGTKCTVVDCERELLEVLLAVSLRQFPVGVPRKLAFVFADEPIFAVLQDQICLAFLLVHNDFVQLGYELMINLFKQGYLVIDELRGLWLLVLAERTLNGEVIYSHIQLGHRTLFQLVAVLPEEFLSQSLAVHYFYCVFLLVLTLDINALIDLGKGPLSQPLFKLIPVDLFVPVKWPAGTGWTLPYTILSLILHLERIFRLKRLFLFL